MYRGVEPSIGGREQEQGAELSCTSVQCAAERQRQQRSNRKAEWRQKQGLAGRAGVGGGVPGVAASRVLYPLNCQTGSQRWGAQRSTAGAHGSLRPRVAPAALQLRSLGIGDRCG